MIKSSENNEDCVVNEKKILNYVIRLWEIGDWRKLSNLAIKKIEDSEEKQQATYYKIIGLIQTGQLNFARVLLTSLVDTLTDQKRDKLLKLLLASLQVTLAKTKALSGDESGSTMCFIKSTKIAFNYRLPIQLHKARIRQQIESLGLNVDCFLKHLKCTPNFFSIPNSANLDLRGDLSFGLWLKLYTWPTDWTVIIGKFINDTENEFCLRIKNSKTAQFFYGDGNSSYILHTWIPEAYFELNQWVHLAVVRRQGRFSRLYINGVLCIERDISGTVLATSAATDVVLLGEKTGKRQLDAIVQGFWITPKILTSQKVRSTLRAVSANLDKAVYYNLSEINLSLSPLDMEELDHVAELHYQAAEEVQSLDYHELIDSQNNEILRIVVVGANDGKYNDPLYEYLISTQRKSNIVLIEPQQQLIAYLQENYLFHPNAHIINVAIGPKSNIKLYAVKKAYWGKLVVPYANERGWPDYRAPTGIVSEDKEYVTKWLNNYLPNFNAEDAIEELTTPSQSLENTLDDIDFHGPIDVLQIDTEGFDDEVIYSSNLERYRPKIIFFEMIHLTKIKKNVLLNFLYDKGYRVFFISENAIALLEDCQN